MRLSAMLGSSLVLKSVLPHLATEGRLVDDGSDTRAAAARAWTAAALGSDPRALAGALERVAVTSATPARAVVLAVAAERYFVAGDSASARRVAAAALQTAPTSARGVSTLAEILQAERDRPAASALDRAIALIGPRPAWCFALFAALRELGDGDRAIEWLWRCVSLRPGSRETIVQLLEHLLATKSGPRLAELLTWLLAQPQPTPWLADVFALGLQGLAALHPESAGVLARRALDVLGPKVASVRGAMLHVSALRSDDSFAVSVLERWLSCGGDDSDRGNLLGTLAELRERIGDREGEARVVARAIREGVSSPALEARLLRLPAPSPDALLWAMAARAESLSTGEDAAAAAWAWRDLGAALWDLADDRMGAITAWRNAAQVAAVREHVTIALDLFEFAGKEFALEYLTQLVETEPDGLSAAAIAADAARAALCVGERHMAFDIAAKGARRSPVHAGALELAEGSADSADELFALSDLYEASALRALGRFGRRAAHYRGARFFDRRGHHELALKHAALAFHAVPAEGSSFHLLARTAELAGDRAHAVRTVEQVAERFDRADMRSSWLLRAASLAGTGEDAARRRVDVLLRATVGAPSVATVALLRDAARDLLGYGSDERDILEMRIGRASLAILERLQGPAGARVALAFATTSLDLFGDAEAAFACFERAFACDPDIEQFAELVHHGRALAGASGVGDRLAAFLSAAEAVHSNVGLAALRAISSVATAMGDEALRARAAVATVRREPDDDALVIEADAAVRAFPDLAGRLAAWLRPARRVDALLAAARDEVTRGAPANAAILFERAADLVDGARRGQIEGDLRAALDAAGRSSEIEIRVQREAASDDSSPMVRADRWSEIADRREVRGDRGGAVRALMEACKLDPDSLQRWSALERVSEAAGEDAGTVMALEQIGQRVRAEGRSAVYKRLARVHERGRDMEAAEDAWNRVLAVDEDDEEADRAIESALVTRGEYERLAHHLARRVDRLRRQAAPLEMVRALRLRRAVILEQRLGREQEACDELASLLGDSPNNVGTLRYLADLLDRQGKYPLSAPLWRRAAAVEADPSERDELELRAGRAAMAARDPRVALDHANRVLARQPSKTEALSLRVDAARAVGSDIELGDALEARALVQTDPLAQSAMLMEAAQAAARAGDPARALQRAQRAAVAEPRAATPQLLARGLEYRSRGGAGGPTEARRTLEDLRQVAEPPLARDDAALRAFLVAEALDVVDGGDSGLRELEAARSLFGDHPLLAVGLAERLTARGRHEAAIEAYRAAIRGSFLDLRKVGAVALAAADVAIQANRRADALHFLDFADLHEEVRTASSRSTAAAG